MLHELEREIEYRDNLYLAEPAKIVAAVRAAPAGVSALMMVGHNPGLEACAALLAREPVRRKERARHEALEEKFPTCALAMLDFDVGRWRDVVQGARQAGGFRAAERSLVDGEVPVGISRRRTRRFCFLVASCLQPKPISGVSSPISRVVRVATRRPPIAS